MKKRFVATLALALAIALLSVGIAGAADSAKTDPTATYQKWVELRKEFVQKQVDAGLITPEHGKYMIERLELAKKNAGQNAPLANGRGGFGMGYRGFGQRGYGQRGFGPGMGGFAAGAACGTCPQATAGCPCFVAQ